MIVNKSFKEQNNIILDFGNLMKPIERDTNTLIKDLKDKLKEDTLRKALLKLNLSQDQITNILKQRIAYEG